ncbi:hypothetical protein D5086_003874 [Populus alba]|uniref:Uncharacterized protein n=1 Tax=Populus alba TaxID=43335 RepID=A0ACC4D663_POPAL
MRKIFVWGRGGLVICRWGDLGLGRRRRNGGGDCRQGGHIFTFSDGLTDGVIPSVNTLVTPSLIVTGNRHVTARTCFFKSLGNSVGILLTVLLSRHRTDLAFKSVGESVGIFAGEPVTSPARVPGFESVGDSVGKITRENLRLSYDHPRHFDIPSMKEKGVQPSIATYGLVMEAFQHILAIDTAVTCWNIANYAAIIKEDGCHMRVQKGCWYNICSPLTLSKKEATMFVMKLMKTSRITAQGEQLGSNAGRWKAASCCFLARQQKATMLHCSLNSGRLPPLFSEQCRHATLFSEQCNMVAFRGAAKCIEPGPTQ